jgi:hypothetical protein
LKAVEVIETLVGVAEAGLFAASLKQSIGTACQFVRNNASNEIDGCHPFGLGLAQSGFEHSGHAAEPQ